MRWKPLSILLFIVLSFSNTSRAQSGRDTIWLYNGQILIGDVRGGQFGEITIDDIDFRITSLKLYKIRRMKTVRRFRLETHARQIYFGVIHEAAREGWVTLVLDGGDSLRVDLNDLSEIIALDKSFWQRLNGNLSAGFTFAKSSNLGQFNFSTVVRYVTDQVEYQLSASGIASIDSTEFSRDREDASIFVNYNFSPTWFAAVGFKYQRNLELSLSRRYQELIGGGNKLVVGKHWQVLAISGITFNEEKTTFGEVSDLLLEVPVTLSFKYFRYRNPNLQITSGNSVYFGLSQKGRIRYDTNTNISWELVRYFALDFTPYASYDNQPPQNGNKFDFGVAISISYRF